MRAPSSGSVVLGTAYLLDLRSVTIKLDAEPAGSLAGTNPRPRNQEMSPGRELLSDGHEAGNWAGGLGTIPMVCYVRNEHGNSLSRRCKHVLQVVALVVTARGPGFDLRPVELGRRPGEDRPAR